VKQLWRRISEAILLTSVFYRDGGGVSFNMEANSGGELNVEANFGGEFQY
jgi:hypothetical protein